MLVSGTVRDLVLGSGIEFSDRGHHALKGVPGEWHVFAVADTSPPPPLIDDSSATSSVADRALVATVRRAPVLGRMFARGHARARARRHR